LTCSPTNQSVRNLLIQILTLHATNPSVGWLLIQKFSTEISVEWPTTVSISGKSTDSGLECIYSMYKSTVKKWVTLARLSNITLIPSFEFARFYVYFGLIFYQFSQFFFCISSVTEIARVRANLFQINGIKKEPLVLPEAQGAPTTLTEKVYVPVKDHPDVSMPFF